jgi:hypothetical protein
MKESPLMIVKNRAEALQAARAKAYRSPEGIQFSVELTGRVVNALEKYLNRKGVQNWSYHTNRHTDTYDFSRGQFTMTARNAVQVEEMCYVMQELVTIAQHFKASDEQDKIQAAARIQRGKHLPKLLFFQR